MSCLVIVTSLGGKWQWLFFVRDGVGVVEYRSFGDGQADCIVCLGYSFRGFSCVGEEEEEDVGRVVAPLRSRGYQGCGSWDLTEEESLSTVLYGDGTDVQNGRSEKRIACEIAMWIRDDGTSTEANG